MKTAAANLIYVVAGLGALSACTVLGLTLVVPIGLGRLQATAIAALGNVATPSRSTALH